MAGKTRKKKAAPMIPNFRGLNIVDDEGRVRIRLCVVETDSGSGPAITLFDTEGKAKFMASLNDAELSSRILIAGPEGHQQIGIGVDEMGAAIMMGDPGGTMRVAFACELGYPSLQLYDAEERLRLTAAETPEGMRLEVLDEAGERAWSYDGKT